MAKNLTISTVLILLLGSTLQAQNIIDFSYSVDTASLEVQIAPIDTFAELEIKNNSTKDITVRWRRTELFLTPTCQTKVCDLNACFPPTFSTRKFDMLAGAEGKMNIHLVNDNSIAAQCIVKLDLWQENIANSDTLPCFFIISVGGFVNTAEPLPQASVQLFPNPVTDYFTLRNATDVSRVRVLDFSGREVQNFTAQQDQEYYLQSVPKGNYLLALEDKFGRLFQTITISKN